jgi:ATP-dependent protease ClpP protease subunit
VSWGADVLGEVARWLDERAVSAPPALAESWRQRAEFYRHTVGLTHAQREYAFRMSTLDTNFDARKLERPILSANTVAPMTVTGPPNTVTIQFGGELGTFDILDIEHQVGRCDKVLLEIDSNGGDAKQSLRLFELLSKHPQVHAHVSRKCYSAAMMLLQAADYRTASKAAQFMVHRCSSFIAGNASQLRLAAELNEEFDLVYLDILCHRTKQPLAAVQDWMSKDTYFDPKEALAAGLIDEILDLDNGSRGTPPA